MNANGPSTNAVIPSMHTMNGSPLQRGTIYAVINFSTLESVKYDTSNFEAKVSHKTGVVSYY